MAKEDLSNLIGIAKNSKMEAPLQKVIPIVEKKKEQPFNIHFPEDLLKNLKMLSVEENTSVKKLIITAVEEKYFTKK